MSEKVEAIKKRIESMKSLSDLFSLMSDITDKDQLSDAEVQELLKHLSERNERLPSSENEGGEETTLEDLDEMLEDIGPKIHQICRGLQGTHRAIHNLANNIEKNWDVSLRETGERVPFKQVEIERMHDAGCDVGHAAELIQKLYNSVQLLHDALIGARDERNELKAKLGMGEQMGKKS